MRKGFVLSYNKIADVGLIRIPNKQHIKFFGDDSMVSPKKGDEVTFDLNFRNGSLIAVNISILNSK